MKTCICFLTLCIAVSFCQKQAEVVTKSSSYVVEEKIISDVSGEREEHRSRITDHTGEVTEHVVIKLFTKRLLISYSSNDTNCIVAPLDEGDTPVPSAVFEEVQVGKTVTASEGKVVEEGVVRFAAVDAEVLDMPEEVVVECGERTPQFIRPMTFTNVRGNKVKRSYGGGNMPPAPLNCGQEMHYKTKCSEKKITSTCCSQCQSNIPYCYKDYFMADIPCTKPDPHPGYGSKHTGYGGGKIPPQTGYGGGNNPHAGADPY